MKEKMPWPGNPAHSYILVEKNKQMEEMEESDERKDAVARKPSARLCTSREKGSKLDITYDPMSSINPYDQDLWTTWKKVLVSVYKSSIPTFPSIIR